MSNLHPKLLPICLSGLTSTLLVACGDDTGGRDMDTSISSLGESGSQEETTETSTTDAGSATQSTGQDPDSEPPPCTELPAPPPPGEADPSCQNEPQVGSFDPVVEWHKDSWADTPTARHSAVTPIVVQLTDDNDDGSINDEDLPDIVTMTWGQGGPAVLRAISGDGQLELLNLQAPGLRRDMSITGADVDNDGIVELLTVTNTFQVLCWEHDGALKWTSPSLASHVSLYDNTPSVSDMDADGVAEIIVGRAILDNQGALIAAGQYGVGTHDADNGYSSIDLPEFDGHLWKNETGGQAPCHARSAGHLQRNRRLRPSRSASDQASRSLRWLEISTSPPTR